MRGAWGIGADRRKAKKIAQTGAAAMLRRSIAAAPGSVCGLARIAPALSGVR